MVVDSVWTVESVALFYEQIWWWNIRGCNDSFLPEVFVGELCDIIYFWENLHQSKDTPPKVLCCNVSTNDLHNQGDFRWWETTSALLEYSIDFHQTHLQKKTHTFVKSGIINIFSNESFYTGYFRRIFARAKQPPSLSELAYVWSGAQHFLERANHISYRRCGV